MADKNSGNGSLIDGSPTTGTVEGGGSPGPLDTAAFITSEPALFAENLRQEYKRYFRSILDSGTTEELQASVEKRGLDLDVSSAMKRINDFFEADRGLQDKERERNRLESELKAKARLVEADKRSGRELKREYYKRLNSVLDRGGEAIKLATELPNLIAEDVRTGRDESDNEVIRDWGEPTTFNWAKDHLVLGEALDIIDVKRAAKVSGARFGYLKGDGVLLEFALVGLANKLLSKEGFIPVIPPALIKKESLQAMGYMEHMGNEDFYLVYGAHQEIAEGEEEYYLVGTSEQSIGPMHKDEVLDLKKPLRYVGFSSCFRREAGSYGKDTKGILRVHQFDKVEMFSYTTAEDDDKEHEFLLGLEEKLFQSLEIPYRVVKMCTGDLGAPVARKYDLEAWMPGQRKYREITSTSTTTDFQARRLNIRYQKNGEMKYVHMLNGTAFAIGRTIVAILENFQQEDGSVRVPEVLVPYVGKEVIGGRD